MNIRKIKGFQCPKCNTPVTHRVRVGGNAVPHTESDPHAYSLPCGHAWARAGAPLDPAELTLALLLID